MIWRRWREARPDDAPSTDEPFVDLLESAPVMAMLLDAAVRLLAANAAARDFFSIDAGRLPTSLLEATRERRLEEAARLGYPATVNLIHHQRVVETSPAPGPGPGLTLLFLTDVTEVARLRTVRQEFVANLAHELKTPLTSLRLAAESLEDAPPGARRRFLARVLTEADELRGIIDNLRQLTEIESGRLELATESIEAEAILRAAAARLGERQFKITVEPGLVLAADRAKLAQALANLVDNAAKFSPPGQAVELSAARERDEILFGVRDHGPGISPEHWERVWERFYKVDPARARDVPGSGLGLAITKHLVLAMGGRVWTRAAEGGGQLFWIALPA